MKTPILGLILLSFATSTFALDKAALDHRIRKLTGKFESMQSNPEKCVPADNLRQAKGVILLDRTKAGFIFAYQGGSGVALAKDPKTEGWSPAAFVRANEASLGFQIGGEKAFYVILLMHTNAVRMLTEARIDFAGEARGTAGDSSAGAEGKISITEHSVLVYDDRVGLYGGAAIKGGAISADDEANRVYYDQYVTLRDILFDKKVKATDSASELAKKVTEHSNKK
ncbi:MAG: lipid-binding SYLF domain-containing protein [Verrucomicrobiota bacterium]